MNIGASKPVCAVLLHIMLAFVMPCFIRAVGTGNATTSPAEIAHYPLSRDANEVLGGNPDPELEHVTFGPWGVELNGIHEGGGTPGGFVVKLPASAVNFDSLAVAVDLVPEDFDPETPTSGFRVRLWRILAWIGMPFPEPTSSHEQLLSLGPGYRYLSLKPEAGGLTVALNNGELRIPIPGTTFPPGRWHRVVVSLDVQAGRLLVSLDGNPAVSSTLPRDWVPNIRELSGNKLASERVFSFTDYSNGAAYHGAAADLRIFGRALSPQEMAALAADRGWERRPLPPYSSPNKATQTLLASLVLLLCLTAGLVWHRHRKRKQTSTDG